MTKTMKIVHFTWTNFLNFSADGNGMMRHMEIPVTLVYRSRKIAHLIRLKLPISASYLERKSFPVA